MNIIIAHIIGIIVGGLFGYFFLYRIIGCSTGACPLTAKPQNAILYGVLLGLVFAGGFVIQESKEEETIEAKGHYQKISSQELKEMVEAGNTLIILDVRTQEEYDEGHAKGAILIPNETIGSERPELLPDLDADIIIYCRSGSRSAQAALKLIALGYTNVYDLGSINNWPYEFGGGK